MKARKLRKRLERTHPQRLITLTLRHDPSVSAADQLKLANRAWSILWRRLRRRFKERAVGYAKIVELQKNGTPHLHIIASVPYVHHAWLSATWNELTGSFIVDVRAVKAQKGISGYLTSYLTKALDVPEGHRKWSASKGYVPPEEPPVLEEGEIPPTAHYATPRVTIIIATYIQAGYTWEREWLIPPVRPPE